MPRGFVVGRQVPKFLQSRKPSSLLPQSIGIVPAQFLITRRARPAVSRGYCRRTGGVNFVSESVATADRVRAGSSVKVNSRCNLAEA